MIRGAKDGEAQKRADLKNRQRKEHDDMRALQLTSAAVLALSAGLAQAQARGRIRL